MDRVLLGRKYAEVEPFSATIISYTPFPSGVGFRGVILQEGRQATVVVDETDASKFPIGFFVQYPQLSDGTVPPPLLITSSGVLNGDGKVEFSSVGIEAPTPPPASTYLTRLNPEGINEIDNYLVGGTAECAAVLGEQTIEGVGLFVSKPTINVLAKEATGANLSFDTLSSSLSSLRVIQTGTFQIQCRKTYFGKKGNLEILSDEQARANAEYTRMYPVELDNLNNSDYITTQSVTSNIFGYDTGYGTATGNGYTADNVQNVYCDYGSTTIEFNPPLPKHIKTPFVSVNFALANNSGHFHPWYANVTCTTGQEDYQWQYANSQHCVHMDSAWFRGKWAFRERSFNPYGDLVNRPYPSDTASGLMKKVNTSTPKPAMFHFDGSNDVGYDNYYDFGYADKSAAGWRSAGGEEVADKDNILGPVVKSNVPHWINDIREFERDWYPSRDKFDFNTGTGTSDSESSEYKDLNSPDSLWGGIFKAFAGLQGMTYYANNTHLKLDAFLTPTHSPTPFETEIVKTREVNPNKATDLDEFNFHNENYLGEWNESFDRFGNIRKNTGWDSNITHGLDPTTDPLYPTIPVDGTLENKYSNWDFDAVANVAWNHGFGLDYKEKLPRSFRTKYWDGTQTEYEWWPIGHANGHFTIATGLHYASNTRLDSSDDDKLLAMLQKDAQMMGFGDKPVYQSEVSPQLSGLRYMAATYGDYRPISYLGSSPYTAGQTPSPFNAIVNKGTRFSNQLPTTEAKGYPSNAQYEPGDAFLKTRTFQGQPTSLDSFWNSFSNNTSQWVSANTPYGEFYYSDGGYAMDTSPYYNYAGGPVPYGATTEKATYTDPTSGDQYRLVKFMPSDWNSQRQSQAKHNWNGGNPKAGVGTEGRRFGFGGAGSAEALGGEGPGVFDTYIGKYVVYDLEGGDASG